MKIPDEMKKEITMDFLDFWHEQDEAIFKYIEIQIINDDIDLCNYQKMQELLSTYHKGSEACIFCGADITASEENCQCPVFY